MKRIMMTIVAAWMMITSMNAQRLTNIQAEARFITDKMVVELGLSKAQRNNLLNINFTYLDGIRSYRDIDAYGWHYRNKQLKRMMTARQWKRFKDSYYFYRPIGWENHVYVHHITPSIQSITGDTTSAAIALSATTEDRDGQAEPMKLTDQESQASITSITSTTRRSGSTTRRNGSTTEIGMMMMTIMTMMMIEIMIEI